MGRIKILVLLKAESCSKKWHLPQIRQLLRAELSRSCSTTSVRCYPLSSSWKKHLESRLAILMLFKLLLLGWLLNLNWNFSRSQWGKQVTVAPVWRNSSEPSRGPTSPAGPRAAPHRWRTTDLYIPFSLKAFQKFSVPRNYPGTSSEPVSSV